MILVAGPTGSGKTATLYAALGLRDTRGKKVITVEHPDGRRAASRREGGKARSSAGCGPVV
ncbi:ATPase, T2SS/T4P/T4SS family [Longimicrobium sp.]|uniref:ATPase, T2SS/T4P/T4SS family n=1 Tax=Longimicrobium sp. TaxID=2029185 RepID=UPI0039C8EBD2